MATKRSSNDWMASGFSGSRASKPSFAPSWNSRALMVSRPVAKNRTSESASVIHNRCRRRQRTNQAMRQREKSLHQVRATSRNKPLNRTVSTALSKIEVTDTGALGVDGGGSVNMPEQRFRSEHAAGRLERFSRKKRPVKGDGF